MKQIKIQTHPDVFSVFDNYTAEVRERISDLRKLIIETANDIPEIKSLEESLKWGEPSYISKFGSTIRIDWKPKIPDQYAMYFKCTSRLVPTFRDIFGDMFIYEENRAILFKMEKPIPVKE